MEPSLCSIWWFFLSRRISASCGTLLSWFLPYFPGLSSIFLDGSSFCSQIPTVGAPKGSILAALVPAKMASSVGVTSFFPVAALSGSSDLSLAYKSSFLAACWAPLDLHTHPIHSWIHRFFPSKSDPLVVVKSGGLEIRPGSGSWICLLLYL